MKTLLLNVGYEPIRILSWKRAITLLWLDKAEVVSEYELVVRSSSLEINIPAVLRLRRYHRQKGQIRLKRAYVYARDHWTCQYCGKQKISAELTYDHIIPQSRGGSTSWDNIVTCCQPCNYKKANRTPKEAGLVLRKKPREPTWLPLVVATSVTTIPPQWKDWLEWLIKKC